MSDTVQQLEVDAEHDGVRLDQYLAPTLGSRSQAVKAIDAGLVTVNRRSAQKRYAVHAGDRILVQAAPHIAAEVMSGPQTTDFEIVFEDEHLLVVDKAAGVVVHPSRGHETGTLAQALSDRAAGGDIPYRAGIVHRLDRDTSGLLVVAKSDEVHRRLKDLLQRREVHREYIAMVDGLPPARSGTVDASIGRDRKDRLLHSVDTDAPREARTHFEVLEALTEVSLLKVVLDTGRTHQIRAHMRAIRHPVTGDLSYGGKPRFGLERQFLHAAELSFPHPISDEPVLARSELPADLASALSAARTA